MATLRKINGRYYAYFYNRMRMPKRKSYPLNVSLKSAAEMMVKRLEEKWAAGSFDPWNPQLEPARLTVQEAADTFLKSRTHLRPKTQTAYRTALEGVMCHVPPALPLHHIESNHIRLYVIDPNVSPSTQRHRARHLRSFFRWAQEEGYLEHDPVRDIKLPKVQKKVADFLTPSKLEQLFRAIEADVKIKKDARQVVDDEVLWLKDVITLAVNTGLRRGELVNLRWQDIDFESGFLTVRNSEDFQTKSGHERSIPIAPEALKVLARLDSERKDDLDGPVLQGKGGGPLNAEYASKRFKYYVRLARLPETIHFHSLRHTCASWLVMRGVPLRIVQAILGHSDISVTQRYAHLAPDVMKKAIDQAFPENSERIVRYHFEKKPIGKPVSV